MILLLVEALAALAALLLIVWWTMFSGRKQGELTLPEPAPKDAPDITISEESKP
ncbi:hypothetical protein [Polaromonas sp. C04]|uniref:hypothetical protein n=1 Tax=Polaromonas sp. C04 TaxID=1945857 RepID=UPI0014388248|nr:hypothetical protein [Polaromonas sp. C04]